MATRAVIQFAKREDGVSFSDAPTNGVTHQIYHHYDGDPTFLGVKLAQFLNPFEVNVRAINDGVDRKVAYDTDCLFAQAVVFFKTGQHYGYGDVKSMAGTVYVESPDVEHGDLDFKYVVWTNREKQDIWISIFNYKDECLFVGQPPNLIKAFIEDED